MPLSHPACSNLRSSFHAIESLHAQLTTVLFEINETGDAKLLIEARNLKHQIEQSIAAIESGGIETKEMKELFGKYCIDPNDIERCATLRDGRKAIEIPASEKAEANLMLLQKLNKPDIWAFIDYLKNNEVDRKNWMLIYCPKGGMLQSLDDNRRAGVNIEAMVKVLDADSRASEPSVPLIHNIRDKEFTPETTLPHGWFFVQTEVVPSTLNKNHHKQLPELKKEAKRLELKSVKRPSPNFLIYSLLMAYKNTTTSEKDGDRHLTNTASWTDSFSDGLPEPLLVGYFQSQGLIVDKLYDADNRPDLGSALSL